MAIVTTHTTGQPTIDQDHIRMMKVDNFIDFDTYNADAADVIELVKIPAGAIVTNVKVRFVTAEDSTCTGDIGDGDDPNGYNDAIDLESAAGTMLNTVAADAYSVGRYYAAADTIDLTLDDAADTCQLYVVAEYYITDRMAS